MFHDPQTVKSIANKAKFYSALMVDYTKIEDHLATIRICRTKALTQEKLFTMPKIKR